MWWAELLNIVAGTLSVGVPPIPTTPVAGYTAWFDAADTGTITVSGSSVTQWNDKSANAYNLTQGTAANRPLSGTRTINSLNVIDFDGTNDSLNGSTASNWTFLNNATGNSIFVVALSDTNAAAGFVMSTAGGSSASVGLDFIRQPAGTIYYFVRRGVGGTSAVSAIAQGTWADATGVYYTLLSTPNNATTLDKAISRVNGGAELKSNTSTDAPSASSPSQPLCVGDASNSAGAAFNGAIAEIILYNSVLNATDRALNESYLANKWGL
jgi:hypothetical protein